jgi:hypothetical protein
MSFPDAVLLISREMTVSEIAAVLPFLTFCNVLIYVPSL